MALSAGASGAAPSEAAKIRVNVRMVLMIVETREPGIGFLVKGGLGALGLRVGRPRPIFRGLASEGPMMGEDH